MKPKKYQQGGFQYPQINYYTGADTTSPNIDQLTNNMLNIMLKNRQRAFELQDREYKQKLLDDQRKFDLEVIERRNQLESDLWEKKWQREDEVYKRERINSTIDKLGIIGKSKGIDAIKKASELDPDLGVQFNSEVFKLIEPIQTDQKIYEMFTKDSNYDSFQLSQDIMSYWADNPDNKSFFDEKDMDAYKIDKIDFGKGKMVDNWNLYKIFTPKEQRSREGFTQFIRELDKKPGAIPSTSIDIKTPQDFSDFYEYSAYIAKLDAQGVIGSGVSKELLSGSRRHFFPEKQKIEGKKIYSSAEAARKDYNVLVGSQADKSILRNMYNDLGLDYFRGVTENDKNEGFNKVLKEGKSGYYLDWSLLKQPGVEPDTLKDSKKPCSPGNPCKEDGVEGIYDENCFCNPT